MNQYDPMILKYFSRMTKLADDVAKSTDKPQKAEQYRMNRQCPTFGATGTCYSQSKIQVVYKLLE